MNLTPLRHNPSKSTVRGPVGLVVCGSTGSIGTSTLSIVAEHPEKFHIVALSAGKNSKLLAQQIVQFEPKHAILHEESSLQELRAQLSALGYRGKTELLAGTQALVELISSPAVHTVVAAIVGVAGLRPVLAALEAGKRVALANKESLVAAGALVAKIKSQSTAEIIPIDSEHSAIFQLLQGQSKSDLQGITLTASGGPFFRRSPESFSKITPAEAVKHPRWNMGAKISVDSATMMNKALEVIEAHWLFGFSEDSIEVLVHPQSIVHSLVHFRDGTMFAHLSVPDMRGAIGYALSYPESRISGLMPRLRLHELERLEFFPLQDDVFPAVSLARECLRAGGAMSAVLNAANEWAVDAFLSSRITFDRIVPCAKSCLDKFSGAQYGDINELLELQRQVREFLS